MCYEKGYGWKGKGRESVCDVKGCDWKGKGREFMCDAKGCDWKYKGGSYCMIRETVYMKGREKKDAHRLASIPPP